MSTREEHIKKILEGMGLEWAEVKQNDDFMVPIFGKDSCEITFRCQAGVQIRKDESDDDIKCEITTILNKLKEGREQDGLHF